MLLQFSVGNFRSFRDEVTLNMAPASLRSMKEHIISDHRNKKVDVLPLAMYYGANASGKSNLVKAMACARGIVLQGMGADEALLMEPFRLDNESQSLPTRFEFFFKHDGIVYNYGFVANRQVVQEEWLFAYFTSSESKLFERTTNIAGEVEVEPGQRLIKDTKGGKRAINLIAGLTEKNQLFLSKANENKVEMLKPVIHWFRDHLTIITPESKYVPLELRSYQDQDFFKHLSEFLRKADTGIISLEYLKDPFQAEKHLLDIPEEVRPEIERWLVSVSDSLEPNKTSVVRIPFSNYALFIEKKASDSPTEIFAFKLSTTHRRPDGTIIPFDLEDESDGTQRMMHLAPMFHEISSMDRVIVIDEIDRSLHTMLTKEMLKLCISAVKPESARGQFIITTHDTNLIDSELFRRDEIRFIEKDRNGASQISNLVEYKVSGGLNQENGYLDGRFGGIPDLREFTGILK